MKKYLLLSILLLFVVTGYFSLKTIIENKEINKQNELNKISDIEESGDSEEIVEDEIIPDESTISVDKTTKVEEKIPEVVDKQEEEKKAINSVKEEPRQNVQNSPDKVENVPQEKPIWEEYGMTKDEYENTPMGGWRKVTHYSYEDCKNAGQSLIDDESNNYHTFWCYEVISYSGKQLGYMLDPE